MKFGDVVRYEQPGEPCGEPWEALVLGEMGYAKDGDVLLIGDGRSWGMPCSRQWLTPLGSQDLLAADRLRRMYLERYPGTLKPHGPETAR
jgi:hypothetical protein